MLLGLAQVASKPDQQLPDLVNQHKTLFENFVSQLGGLAGQLKLFEGNLGAQEVEF